jgi:hypothetical protein
VYYVARSKEQVQTTTPYSTLFCVVEHQQSQKKKRIKKERKSAQNMENPSFSTISIIFAHFDTLDLRDD